MALPVRAARLAALVLLAALAERPAAQDVLGIVGTWEATATENTPGTEKVVFTRMTFTGDRLVTTAVFLDPDDGELSARITDDGYVVSDGQLVVRATGSTTVLDAARDPAGLTVRDTRSGVVVTLRAADPADALDPALVGVWEGGGGGHRWRFDFRADGRATVRRDADDPTEEPYTVAGPYLLVDRDAYRFTFVGGRLMLDREDESLDLLPVAASADARPVALPPLSD